MFSLKIFTLLFFSTVIDSGFGFLRFKNIFRSNLSTTEFLGRPQRSKEVDLEDASQWITQPLNHFDPNDSRKWQMQYLQDLQYWQTGGPIIIFIGGEAGIIPADLSFSLITSFAQEVHGAIYVTEHRFYGKSVPFNDNSLQNLSYLSSMQALADLKNFIQQLKTSDQYKNAKVVVISGSYPGNLAAWSRLLYPDLIDAAVASSAPVLAKSNFNEYFKVVGDVIKKFNPPCYDYVVKQFKSYAEMLQTFEGREQLKGEENICDHVDLTLSNNNVPFILDKLFPYADLVQYGTPEKIRTSCIQNSKIDSIFFNGYCHDYSIPAILPGFKGYVNSSDSSSWAYQTCAEFGYYMTVTKDSFPFSVEIPLDYYLNTCNTLYHIDPKTVESNVIKTNQRYQGLTPNVEKVFFVHGDMDPWHPLGILKDLSNEAPARIIPNASHCAGLSDSDENTPERTAVRELIKKKLREWIAM